MRIPALIVGFGNISQGFASVLTKKAQYLRETLGIEISVIGVVEVVNGRFESALSKDGLDLDRLLRTKRQAGKVSAYPGAGGNSSTLELIRESGAQIVLEATPTNIKDGEPGLSHIRSALDAGIHVVTSNKGPLLFGLRELRNLARAKGVEFRYSAAVAGALPVITMGYYSLVGCRVNSIEGILNGTTNYILTEMAERDVGLQEALADAQRMGIAETDPRLDIEGYDTAFKLLIAANSIMNTDAKISDVGVSGIESITRETVRDSKRRGYALKLIGRARRVDDGVEMKVALEELPTGHPFYSVNGVWKAVMFDTDLLGEVLLLGGKSNPELAAGAMLRDIVNIVHDTSRAIHRCSNQ